MLNLFFNLNGSKKMDTIGLSLLVNCRRTWIQLGIQYLFINSRISVHWSFPYLLLVVGFDYIRLSLLVYWQYDSDILFFLTSSYCGIEIDKSYCQYKILLGTRFLGSTIISRYAPHPHYDKIEDEINIHHC